MISNVIYVTRGSKRFKINYHVYMYHVYNKSKDHFSNVIMAVFQN